MLDLMTSLQGKGIIQPSVMGRFMGQSYSIYRKIRTRVGKGWGMRGKGGKITQLVGKNGNIFIVTNHDTPYPPNNTCVCTQTHTP